MIGEQPLTDLGVLRQSRGRCTKRGKKNGGSLHRHCSFSNSLPHMGQVALIQRKFRFRVKGLGGMVAHMSPNVAYASIMFLAGIGIPVLASLNASLGTRIGSPAVAALCLFFIAFVATGMVVAATGTGAASAGAARHEKASAIARPTDMRRDDHR